ncbi:prepilin peptidase [Limosilactobacillus sp.]|uniref:prepilin peptidase n=1 Tax=Limosilactobacillus sp. TaxID=2773925 RepID=UPI0025BD92C3|nr:A24 family peptidase [Limosilactobacillus sp.]MCH3921266.1 prepilin peptidase [Limosilactobacillus sp.]MCH3928037.1 prepilin peptidase [Limosilactobacillus sp.]
MLILLVFTVLATCTTSFINLCAYRLGQGQSPHSPARSYCEHCHRALSWWQLIPICGYLLQAGRCRFCRQPINPYWPLSEASCGLLMFCCGGADVFHNVLVLIFLMALLFITTTDLLYQVLYPLSLIGLITLAGLLPDWHWSSPSSLLIGGGFLVFIGLLTLPRHGMGSGDLMYLTVVFIFFGWYKGVILLLVACLLALPCFAFSRATVRLPFLPALCLATVLVLIFCP